jgi:transposase
MIDLLWEINQAVATVKQAGQTALTAEQIADCEQRYCELLSEGEKANPPVQAENSPKKRGRTRPSPARNLLLRLSRHQRAVLACMDDVKVPFDTNQAERDLRMVKLNQKVSGCFRTPDGTKTCCPIRSDASTARKHGQNVLQAVYLAMLGKPFQWPDTQYPTTPG